MTDVIRNINSNSQVTGSSSKSTTKPTDGTGTQSANSANTPATNSVDQVELTNSVQKVDQLIANLSAEPVVDRQKIDAIKSALVEGRYQVDSAAIADKLLEIDELLQ